MSSNDFVIENGILKKYIGNGGDVVIPDVVTEIGSNAFDGVSEKFNLTVPESVNEISYSAFFRCPGLTALSLSRDLAKGYITRFETCPNLHDLVISDVMKISVSELEHVNDIVISVKDILFSDKVFDEGKCRNLLESLGKDCNLHAIWSSRDKSVASKLEKTGLKQYFKNCFEVDSFENNFGKKIMSGEFFINTVKAEVKKQYADDPHRYYNCDMLILSDKYGSYQKGTWFSTVFYDPDNEISWELPSDGYVVHDFDGILNAVANNNLLYKLEKIKFKVETEFSAYEWLGKYEQYLTRNPEISFENSVFVFNGFSQNERDIGLITKAIDKGGIKASGVTGKTDYLVVNPLRAGETQITKALNILQKGGKIKIILKSDFEKLL
jgi:hypothetical protein